MESMNALMREFKQQLERGTIQKAYQYIFAIFSAINGTYKKVAHITTGAIYHGYLDMNYLPIFTEYLKANGLKIALVFDYNKFEFVIWLSGNNKKTQRKIWDIVKAKQWTKYKVLESLENEDAIIEYVVGQNLRYDDLNEIVDHLMINTNRFIHDVEEFMKKNV